MALPVLPQDVFDEIIGQLTGEPSTLKACSLVCRSFRRNAQKMLFNRAVVMLGFDDSMVEYCPNVAEYIFPLQQPINLVLIVKHAPHLIEYIQELTISCLGDACLTLINDTDDIANALAIFSRKGEFSINLQSLSLLFDDLWWHDIDSWVQDALMFLMSADSLQHIALEGILDYPAEPFQNLPHLKHLSLINTTFSSLPATQKELPKLESLAICPMEAYGKLDQFLNNVERSVNTTQLKTFEGDWKMATIERILQSMSNSLEHLILRRFNITDPDSVSINLNRFSRLTDITIYQYITHEVPSILILITKTMKNISPRNVFQNLLFDFSSFNIADFESVTKDAWQEVDTIWSIPQLVSSELFRGITFSVRSTARNCDAFSDLLQNKLPETKKVGKLHIKTSPR